MDLLNELLCAWKGSYIWRCIKHRNKIGKRDVVIFFAERDDELNYYAAVHADKLLKKKYGEDLFIVSSYEDVLNNLPMKVNKYKSVLITDKEFELIKKYYCLVRFSDYVCFVAIKWPESNRIYRLLGKNGVDKEDIVCLGLYGLRYAPKMEMTKI